MTGVCSRMLVVERHSNLGTWLSLAVRKPDSIRWKLQQEVSPLWEMPSAVGASKERMKVENLSYT